MLSTFLRTYEQPVTFVDSSLAYQVYPRENKGTLESAGCSAYLYDNLKPIPNKITCFPTTSNAVQSLLRTPRENLVPRGPFLKSPGNLQGPISVFGDKCFLTEANFCQLKY